MCGRFSIMLEPADYREEMEIADFPEDFMPRYNVAPTQPVLAILDPDRRQAEWLRWGLVPSWAKDPSIGSRMINARAETLQEKPSFRSAFLRRRCAILADGFYEWQKPSGGKGRSQPFYIRRADRRPFAFAGLWDVWKPAEGEPLRTCTIITTGPNSLLAPIHDRMPVILDRSTLWNWLQPAEPAALQSLLRAYPPERMEVYPIGLLVNNARLDTAEIIRPI